MGIKNALKPIKKGVVFVKCWIRIITNFPKCVTFYVLDYIKYIFIFVPLFIISVVTGAGKKENNRRYNMMNNLLKWSPGIQYDCYICKKKKPKKVPTFLQQMFKALSIDNTDGLSVVVLCVLCFIFACSYLYHYFFGGAKNITVPVL